MQLTCTIVRSPWACLSCACRRLSRTNTPSLQPFALSMPVLCISKTEPNEYPLSATVRPERACPELAEGSKGERYPLQSWRIAVHASTSSARTVTPFKRHLPSRTARDTYHHERLETLTITNGLRHSPPRTVRDIHHRERFETFTTKGAYSHHVKALTAITEHTLRVSPAALRETACRGRGRSSAEPRAAWRRHSR